MANTARTIGLFLGCVWSATVAAGDWDPFPLGQRSTFLDSSTPSQPRTRSYMVDSMLLAGQGTVLHFTKDWGAKRFKECYPEVLATMHQDPLFYGAQHWYMDSLVVWNDTIFHFWQGLTFYFLPQAGVGQSWTVRSAAPGNEYDEITITCTDITEETVLGALDSVKTFRVDPGGSTPGQGSFTMALSRRSGFVRFMPFHFFLHHPRGVAFRTMELIGLEDVQGKRGYTQPKFEDYFHLAPGDILLWRYVEDPDAPFYPGFVEYYRDSITGAVLMPDSVVYTYDRKARDRNGVYREWTGLVRRILRTEVGGILEAQPDWIGFGNNHMRAGSQFPQVEYWRIDWSMFSVDPVRGDTLTSMHFSNLGHEVDTSNCSSSPGGFDYWRYFTFDTRAGLIEDCFRSHGTYCLMLIGSRVAGHQIGDISLAVQDHGPITTRPLLFPNPATDVLNVSDIPAGPAVRYQLFRADGRLVEESTLRAGRIAVGHLDRGLYFLQLTADKMDMRAAFVKE